ncbi:helix-hairpin-helix domain-containing protein [Arundinibacter roseus]|uniref:Helix-hairpin-helix domain-containing protein n=1 Tax=Arundinibacter roseus TaxID=2070510 RepID=A0A4R4K858_9BACT|nr:helix-hairpin-helix domain-containing protein [Arundinibacter roseus]
MQLVCLLFVTQICISQTPPRQEIDFSSFIQELFPVPVDDANYNDLYEALFQLYANPLDLNTATRDELAATFILTAEQLDAFIAYRGNFGALLSLYELQAVPTFDLPTIRRLLPFVTLQPRQASWNELLHSPTQHFLILRSERLLEQQKGFSKIDSGSTSTSRYAGGPYQLYARYRYARAGAYSLGFTFEQDAGERWNWQPKRQIFGVDFTSFHAQLQNRGIFKNVILGDFQMQAGQGLLMAAGFGLGKGTETILTGYRSTLGLRPHTSVLEAGFFRGAAATLALTRQWDMTVLASGVRRDASLNTDSEELLVSSLLLAGLHRTPAEREKQALIPEKNLGFHTAYNLPGQRGKIGLTALYTHFGVALERRNLPYNVFEFKGKNNLSLGLHGDYLWKNLHFFGEGGRSSSGGLGGIGGLIAPLGRTLDATFILRHYDRNFHTFYGSPLTEGSRPINESGAYWGLRYSPNRRWQFSGFYDRFSFPWLKYQVNAPSEGNDRLLHVRFSPNKKFTAVALFHQEQKERNRPGNTTPLPELTQTIRRTASLQADYDVPLRFAIRTRIQAGQFVYRGISSSTGFTVVQDITWRLPKIEISARMAFFATDNYDSRQYVYEKDVLYAFSLPAYYNRGTRHYLMARYAVSKKIRVWLRWSQSRFSNQEEIGSGLSQIEGPTRSELKAQLMYTF